MPTGKKPKIVLWDIETSYSVVTTFGLWPKYIPHNNILQDWNILSVAWKELGKKSVYSAKVDAEKVGDDAALVRKVHDVLMKTDILVHHNGDKFDLKKFNTRCIYHGLPPLPEIRTVDTLKVAKKVFSFTSNRLDYLGDFLSCGRKMSTESGLWMKVLAGDPKALNAMVRYNKQDVLLLEEVYKKFLPYITNHPNLALHTGRGSCPICGSFNLTAQGTRKTRSSKYQRYKCGDCGGWSRGTQRLYGTDII